MRKYFSGLVWVASVLILFGLTPPAHAARFEVAKFYIEYNDTDNDLGFHVSLDGEDWKALRIVNPAGETVFQVEGRGGYEELGLTELFFEGAEPTLDEFPLNDLLALFPEGRYLFEGETVDGRQIFNSAVLSHAVPAAPVVSTEVEGDSVIIHWNPVVGTPEGFPARRITIAGYQVIVESFQVTLPAGATEVTVPPQFVQSLKKGEHNFEVLAIETGGNQTITEATFEID